MAPRDRSHLHADHDELDLVPNGQEQMSQESIEEAKLKEEIANFKLEIVWRNVILMAVLHVGALYGLYLCLAGRVMWQTIAFGKSTIN